MKIDIIDIILFRMPEKEKRKIIRQMVGEQRRYDKYSLIRTSRNYQRKNNGK